MRNVERRCYKLQMKNFVSAATLHTEHKVEYTTITQKNKRGRYANPPFGGLTQFFICE